MVEVFLFLWSWTDRFCSVDPWFQDELDSGYNIQFFYRRPTNMLHIICQKRCLWFRIMLFLESGIHGPKLIGPGPPKKENLDPFGPRTAQRNFGPVQTRKKIKKISDQLGSLFRTKKLHWSLKSHHLSLESIWVIPYESYFLHFHYQWLFVHWKSTHNLFRAVHPS